MTLGGAAVSWASKKHTLVALSNEEAEYTVFTGEIKTLLIKLLYVGHPALKHVRTEGITARTKHFDIRLQHLRNNQNKGTIAFEYIRSASNTADILSPPKHLGCLGL